MKNYHFLSFIMAVGRKSEEKYVVSFNSDI